MELFIMVKHVLPWCFYIMLYYGKSCFIVVNRMFYCGNWFVMFLCTIFDDILFVMFGLVSLCCRVRYHIKDVIYSTGNTFTYSSTF